MSCYIPYNNLESALYAAYNKDFEKYKELSNVVDMVMNLSIQPEAKIHAVWYYAGFIHSTAQRIVGLQTESWKSGVYKNLYNYLDPYLDGKVDFVYEDIVEGIKSFFPITEDNRTLSEVINDDIDELPNIAEDQLADEVNSILKRIQDNRNVLDVASIDPENTTAGLMLNKMRAVISAMTDSPLRVTLLSKIEYVKNQIVSNTENGRQYFDIGLTEGVGIHNGEPIKMLAKRTGEKIQVVFAKYPDRKGELLLWDPTSPDHLQPYEKQEGDHVTDALPYKNNSHFVDGNDGRTARLHAEEIFTGLRIPSENDKVQGQMAQELSDAGSLDSYFVSGVNIIAHTHTVALNIKRIANLRELFPSLNRAFETMERPNQREYLRSGQGPVLTFLKPTSGFTVRISNISGDKSFDLESFADLAFVYPDNTVVPFDPENPDHIELLKSTAQSRVGSEKEYTPITDAEIIQIKESILRYRAFEKEVMDRLKDGVSVNIKDIFFKYYDLHNNIQSTKLKSDAQPKMSLQQFIDANNGRLPVTLQRMKDRKPIPGDTYEEKIPIILRNIRGIWEVVTELPQDTRIYSAKTNKTYASLAMYLQESEGINIARDIVSLFGKNSAVYISLRQTGSEMKPIVIPLIYDKTINDVYDAVSFSSSLLFGLQYGDIQKDNNYMAILNNDYWGFDVMKEDQIRPQFTILKKEGKAKILGIRFFALPGMDINKQEYFDDEVKKYDIPFDKKILSDLESLLTEMRKKAGIEIETGASISDVNAANQKAAEILGSDNPVVNQIKQKVDELSADIYTKYRKTMAKYAVDVERGETSRLFSPTFIDYSVFDNTNLKVKSRKQKLNYLSAFKKLETNQITRSLSLSNRDPQRRIMKSLPQRRIAQNIIINDAHNPPVYTPPPVPVSANIPDPSSTSTADESTPTDPNELPVNPNDDIQFSLVNSLESFLTLSEEDFSSEIEAMRSLIPTAFRFTSEGFDNLDVDGDALGYIQDLMIHLNHALKAKGVAYHEGFHAVFRRLLSRDQQAYYLQKASQALGDYKTDSKGKYIQVGTKKVYANDFRVQRRYGHLNDEQIKNLIYEEWLADSFASFMETNKVPRTWMEKLFVYLKKLLNLFKKGGKVDNLFYDISLGKFSTAPIIDHQGPNSEKVYSLNFKGLPVVYINERNQPLVTNLTIPSNIVIEVRDKILQGMASLEMQFPDLKYGELYEKAKERVLSDYSISVLTSQKPERAQEIINVYGDFYSNARWLMGALQEGEKFYYKNTTKNLSYNDKIVDSDKQTAIVQENSKKFKSEVISAYKQLNDLSDPTDDEAVNESLNREEEETEVKDSFYEGAGFIGVKPDEGNSAFRKLFKLLSYEETDPVFGIKIRRMVDSSLIFSTITKITARQPKENIIQSIIDQIEKLDFDISNFNKNIKPYLNNPFEIPNDIAKMMRLHSSLKAVYDTLESVTGMTEANYPTRNHDMLNQFLTVFYNTDAKLIQADVITKENFDGVLERQDLLISDIVIAGDIVKIRNEFKDNLMAINVSNVEVKPIIDTLKKIASDFKEGNLEDLFFNADGMFNDLSFRQYVNNIYISLSRLNIAIPYDVIYTGLAYEVYMTMGADPNLYPVFGDLRKALRANKEFFNNFENAQLEFWFKDLPSAIQESVNTSAQSKIGQTNTALNKIVNRTVTKYVNAYAPFIIKLDPTIAGSSTKNSNGDTVYKYVKPIREFILTQELQKGDDIAASFREFVQFYHPELIDYFNNNPMLDVAKPNVRAFLKNMTMETFAGFQQKYDIGDKTQTGQQRTFKDIDDRAYILSMMALFSNLRTVNVRETGENITIFKRILTVYEATGTSVVTDGVLERYFKEDATPVIIGKYPKHVNKLLDIVKQEYELIRKNFEDNKNNAIVKKYKDYNINPDKDRGFRFNVLSDFFSENEALGNELIAAAKAGESFDAILGNRGDQTLVNDLNEALRIYSAKQYKEFLNLFDNSGLTYDDLPINQEAVDGEKIVSLPIDPEAFIREFFFNNWINSLYLNQIYDGSIALGIKDFATYFKRQKSGAAAGDNLYNPLTNQYGLVKTYRAAVMGKVVMYLDNTDLTKPMSFTPYYPDAKDDRNKEVEIFDGQTINLVGRRAKVADARGRLDRKSQQIILRMKYETKDTKEYIDGIRHLNKRGIVFNSLKSVTAAPMQYIKQSEHTIIRKDVSMLKPGLDYLTTTNRLAVLYERMEDYSNRLDAGMDIEILDPDSNSKMLISELYQKDVKEAHSYFVPIPNRVLLHHILNSMEYHRVEQLMDPSSSKKSTVQPVPIDLTIESTDTTYFDFDKSIDNIPNELTFIQVATEKDATVVTQGIQQKLLLISQLDPESAEYKHLSKEINAYRKGLADAMRIQLNTVKRLLNTNDKEIISKIYETIYAGLKSQNADITQLQYFELNADGTPKYDPNLPVVADTIKNYFFALFNKSIFDKKIPGRKYYHVSSLGYNVLEMDGKVVTTQEYKKNPTAYKNAKSRPLNVIKQSDGTYVVEAIIPKDLSPEKQAFMEKYLSLMFATRIPTEDKRSMVVLKVVDYMDEAYGSGIVLPFQVHLLAGSDFDIDTLYAHVFGSYRTIDGEQVIYGDYAHYKSKYGMSNDEAAFVEYLTYMTKDEIISPLLKNELRRIKDQTGYLESQAVQFGELFGENISKYFTENKSLMDKEETGNEDQDDLVETFKKLIATYNILKRFKDSDLPTTPAELKKYTKSNGSPVVNIVLNQVLDAKIKILMDPVVYEKFMQGKDNRADEAVKEFVEAVSQRGMSEQEIYNKQNVYTPTALIVARNLNSESKDSLGISASFNKGISMLATINGKLKSSVGALFVRDNKGFTKMSVLANTIVVDSVQKVGSAIGLFADAPKNPYPGPLHLNNITAPIMLTMFALGWPKKASILFQSIPIIKSIISEYNKTSGSAYKRNIYQKDMYFDKYLISQIRKDFENKDVFSYFNNKEMFLYDKYGHLEYDHTKGIPKINRKKYKLIWNEKLVKPDDPGSKIQPISNNGFQIVDENGISFPKEIEDLIVLYEMSNYQEIASDISFNVTSLTNTLKALKPDIGRLDKLINNYYEIRSGIIKSKKVKWTSETIEKLFEEYPVLKTSKESLDYMDDVSKLVFLDRTSFFRGLTSLISNNIYGYDSNDIKKDVLSYIGLQLQRAIMEKNPDKLMSRYFLSQINPEGFLNGDVIADYNILKQKYPNNKFLNSIRPVDIGTVKNPVRILESFTSKITPENREAIHADLLYLMSTVDETEVVLPDGRSEKILDKERAIRIAYHGMIKSGAQKQKGGYYELLPAIFSKSMSDALTKFHKELIDLDIYITDKYENMDTEGGIDVEPDGKREYVDKLTEILNKNFKEQGIVDIVNDVIVKVLSMKIMDGTQQVYKRTADITKLNTRYEKENIKFSPGMMLELFKKIAPSNYKNIINETGNRAVLELDPLKAMGPLEYELFTPEGNTLTIDLNEKLSEEEILVLNEFKIYGRDTFNFPLYRINAYGQLMILESVDDRSLGESFIETSFETAFKSSDSINLWGKKAVYKVVAKEGATKISPLAFDKKSAAMLTNIIMGIQQISSKKVFDLPPMMNVIRSENRMWHFGNEMELPIDYRNTTFANYDFTTVTTTDQRYGYVMDKQKLLQYEPGTNQYNIIKQDMLDMFAKKLGKDNWQDLLTDERFTDFVNGQSAIYVYNLNNGDPTSPTSVVPPPPVQSAPAQPSTGVKPTERKTYSGKVTSLQPNQIFVFGSNPLGINGNPSKGTGGAALVAYNIAGVKQGEKMDNKLSDSGKAWGMTTVTAPGKKRSKTPEEITEGIKKLYEYAKQNPTKEFLVSDYSGTNLNGYTGQEMADMFVNAGPIPSNIVFNDNFDKLISTQPSTQPTGVKVISEDYGVVVAETNPSKEFDEKLADAIYKDVAENAYVENGSNTAQRMWANGLMWKGNNTKKPTGKPLKVIPAQVDYNANGKLKPVNTPYFYDPLYNDGTPVAPISDLDFLKRHIEKTLGIDMSDYDVSLNNIYEEGHNLFRHTDIDESNTAKNYPVIVYVFGNTHKVRFDDNGGKRAIGAMVNPKPLTLKNGDIYTFGMDGKGRFETVHDVVASPKTDSSFPPLIGADGKPTNKYTVTFTFRRAGDLTAGMPTAPAKLTTQPSAQPAAPAKSIKLFDSNDKVLKKGSVVEYNGKKYLFWNQNKSGKAQLINEDGTKFSGTPGIDKLTVLGSYQTTVYNKTEYIVTDNNNIYSGATGNIVYAGSDNSSMAQKERIIAAAKSQKMQKIGDLNSQIDNVIQRKSDESSNCNPSA